jgi:hypothetical protein
MASSTVSASLAAPERKKALVGELTRAFPAWGE